MRIGADAVTGKSGLERPMPGPTEGYKPHIDGLRAISIVAVVAFHADVSGFGGGFVGVDIFFVISGFLIINQIVGGLQSGRFSVWDFYARRALRILPSYGAMLVFTAVCGAFILRSPRDLKDFAASAASAPLFLTNIFFLLRSGYFDLSADLKPLLHTWSLAVEEQFYLVVPLLLAGLALFAQRRGWRMGPLLALAAIVIGLASLVGSILTTSHDMNPWTPERNPAFFLTWWRAWEFVAGGVIAALAAPLAGKRLAAPAGTLAGLAGAAMLGLSIGMVGLEWLGAVHGGHGRIIGYPGIPALLPVAGAMLIIWSGLVAPRGPVALVLSLAPIVYLGQISYALYLWHWPLLVFGRFLPVQLPRDLINAGAVGLAVLLAIGTRLLIEQPILAWRRRVRLGSDRRLPLRISLASIVCCVGLAAASGIGVGIAFLKSLDNPMIAAVEAAEVHASGPCVAEDIDTEVACLDGAGPDGLLVGDSHAFANMPRITFEAEQRGVRIMQLATPGCDPLDVILLPAESATNIYCKPQVDKLERFIPHVNAGAFVILDGFWDARFLKSEYDPAQSAERLRAGFGKLMQNFAGDGARRVLVFGPVPTFPGSIPFNCINLAGSLGLSLDRCGVPRTLEDDRRRETVAIMKSIVATYPNARFIDPVGVFCDERICMPVKDGKLAFADDHHVNAIGSKLLFDTFRDDLEWAFKG